MNLTNFIRLKHEFFNKIKLQNLNFTALIKASAKGNSQIVQLLLAQKGIDINIQDIKI